MCSDVLSLVRPDAWDLMGVTVCYRTKVVSVVCRYDMKGCEVGRWTDPAHNEKQRIVVLKDMNFEGQHINLGKKGQSGL